MVRVAHFVAPLTLCVAVLGCAHEPAATAAAVVAPAPEPPVLAAAAPEPPPGWLGVVFARERRPNQHPGALIKSLVPTAAAARGGVLAGDILTSFDGRAVSSAQDLIAAVGGHFVGQQVSMQIWRDGVEHRLQTTLGPRLSFEEIFEARWVGRQLPAGFSFRDAASGETITVESMRGTAFVLEHWATWCHPCAALAPYLRKLLHQFGDLRILSISSEPPETIDRWMADWGSEVDPHKRILTDPRGLIDGELMLPVTPTLIYVSADGVVRSADFGMQPYAEMAAKVRQALQPAAAIN